MTSVPERRIGNVTGWILILLAFTIDITQIVLNVFAIGIVANKYITIIAGFLFVLLLAAKGVPILSNTKILGRLAVIFGGEAIPLPFLDAFLFWTLAVWSIVRTVQQEDNMLIREAEEANQAEEERIQEQKIARMQLESGEDFEEAA